MATIAATTSPPHTPSRMWPTPTPASRPPGRYSSCNDAAQPSEGSPGPGPGRNGYGGAGGGHAHAGGCLAGEGFLHWYRDERGPPRGDARGDYRDEGRLRVCVSGRGALHARHHHRAL